MPTRRPVIDRLGSLASPPAKPDGTLNMAESILRGFRKLANSEEIVCTVDRHCRTRIFGFPEARAAEPVPHHTVYESDPLRASLVCDLETYFKESGTTHYSLSPPLRHEVAEKREALEARRQGRYLYLVIEEVNEIPPLVLERGCAIADEVFYEAGERKPLLKGGRDNERFIVAFETSDGPWPDIPRNEQTVNMILAVARASQDAQDEIPKHVDESCLLTDDERVVFPLSAGFASARLSVHYNLDPEAFRKRAAEMNAALSLMKADLTSEHIELLVNALYWDDYRDDDFRRLHFLSLWQSLCESRRKLGYVNPDPKIELLKNDSTVVAGTLSLATLAEYRDDIAHCRTGSIDGNYLAGMYRTINELIRRKYFR